MAERFRPRHVVAIIAILASAYVLTSPAAQAITGTVVNLADRTTSSYAEVVGGALRVAPVEARTSTNLEGGVSNVLGNTRDLLLSGTGPNRFAITQITTSFNTFSNTTPSTVFVNFSFYYRTSGTGTCGNVENNITTGFTLVSLRRFMVPAGETVDLTFATRPLLTPAVASGRPWCMLFGVVNPGSLYAAYVGVTGYIF